MRDQRGGSAQRRRSLRGALLLLVVVVLGGLLSMHTPLVGSSDGVGSSSAHAAIPDPTPAAPAAMTEAQAPPPVPSHLLWAAALWMGAMPTAIWTGPGSEPSAAAPAHPAGCTGHGPVTHAHAAACDLFAPQVNAATALGAAVLVAVVLVALLSLPSGAAAGGWRQRRGPPRGRLLGLLLCVIRV